MRNDNPPDTPARPGHTLARQVDTPAMESALAASDGLDPLQCHRALQARDARFDGRFFIAVKSTRIYCRPVCRVRIPKPANCRFFRHAAQCEQAGYRPCLRCRPELAPLAERWSIQDAGAVLAAAAARRLDETDGWTEAPSVAALAARMGVSDRHLRRLFEAHFGVSPLQYLQTRRLHAAKQLLTDTRLPIGEVASASGFGSLRRFNAAFMAHYRMTPTRLRRERALDGPGSTVRLGYRPPYDIEAMLGFLERRCITGLEAIDGAGGKRRYLRTLRIESGGRLRQGWIEVSFEPERNRLALRIDDGLRDVLPAVIRRVRSAFDLDADPSAIDAVLAADFPGGAGLRVPGTVDGFELAVRAILGQQVTVAAARTIAGRLVERFGDPIATPHPGLDRLFPTPARLAHAQPDALGELGIVRQRHAAIIALARAVDSGELPLTPAEDPAMTMARLRDLPGIGDWTAQYIAMRALHWPDAFPAGDIALQRALGLPKSPSAAAAAERASQAWQPWRSYAVLRAWQASPQTAQTAQTARAARAAAAR